MKLILTCEHAGNEIPDSFQDLFTGVEELLETHRGFDPGAFDLFLDLKDLADFSQYHSVSRLLIEVNRSLGNKQLFSEFTSNLSIEKKELLVRELYLPYRNSVEEKIEEVIEHEEEVFHLSIHSFTPVLNKVVRNADIGILYDPKREQEKEIGEKIKEELFKTTPNLKVRKNYPYKGIDDGFTTYLRRKFPFKYLGIELEVNQKFVNQNRMDERINKAVHTVIGNVLKK